MKNLIICIGRKYGSGGGGIEKILSKQLSIPCYDKLLIKKTVMESGLTQEYLENSEETPINMGRFLSGNSFADTENKVKRIIDRNKISEKKDVQKIRRMDRMGKQFFDFYSDSIWRKTESYDIMLSSGKLGIESCVNLIAEHIKEQAVTDYE